MPRSIARKQKARQPNHWLPQTDSCPRRFYDIVEEANTSDDIFPPSVWSDAMCQVPWRRARSPANATTAADYTFILGISHKE